MRIERSDSQSWCPLLQWRPSGQQGCWGSCQQRNKQIILIHARLPGNLTLIMRLPHILCTFNFNYRDKVPPCKNNNNTPLDFKWMVNLLRQSMQKTNKQKTKTKGRKPEAKEQVQHSPIQRAIIADGRHHNHPVGCQFPNLQGKEKFLGWFSQVPVCNKHCELDRSNCTAEQGDWNVPTVHSVKKMEAELSYSETVCWPKHTGTLQSMFKGDPKPRGIMSLIHRNGMKKQPNTPSSSFGWFMILTLMVC